VFFPALGRHLPLLRAARVQRLAAANTVKTKETMVIMAWHWIGEYAIQLQSAAELNQVDFESYIHH
jgi:hypothetical protein